MIICNTIKGKGVSFMENNKGWHHGSINSEQFKIAMKDLEKILDDLRDIIFDNLVYKAKKNKKIIFLCNDMDVFSLIDFKKNFPNRVINIGVAEQKI